MEGRNVLSARGMTGNNHFVFAMFDCQLRSAAITCWLKTGLQFLGHNTD